MPNQATMKVLDELKQAGFNVDSIITQAQNNPLQEKQLDASLGTRVLNSDNYTSFAAKSNAKVASLEQQVVDLAAAQDNLKSYEKDSALYNEALKLIQAQRAALIHEGYGEEELRSLSLDIETGLGSIVAKAHGLKEGEKVVPNNDNNANSGQQNQNVDMTKYVTTDDLNKVGANIAFGNLATNAQMVRQMFTASQLGIEITDELAEKFNQNLFEGLQRNKTVEQIADDTFGITAKRTEIQTKKNQEQIDSQVREKVAAALKEHGVATPIVAQQKRSIGGTMSRLNNPNATLDVSGEGGSRQIGNLKVPINKNGDIEYYRLRGDSNERITTALANLNHLAETQPQLFEDVY